MCGYCGGGFECEYPPVVDSEDGGAENPEAANNIPGGKVIRPCLKHTCDTEMQ